MKDLQGKLAVVTGASSGLGVDFADLLAHRGCRLLLVARREAVLRELQQRLIRDTGASVDILPLDLAEAVSPAKVFETLARQNLRADFLINNAGFGALGSFAETPLATDDAMINVNLRALHHLTKLGVQHMLAQGGGRILNVASVVGYQPAPYFAVYAATKAYVLNLTEALHFELAGSGVHVCALCPGTTRTGFWKVAGSRGNPIRERVAMESRDVAAYGLQLMFSNKSAGIPGWKNRLMIFSGRFLPRSLVIRITAWVMKG